MDSFFEYGIIGMGPAGIGVAISLSTQGLAKKTICFEQGRKEGNGICAIDSFQKCYSCNRDVCQIITGVGGASNMSSGKLSYYPAGSGLLSFFDTESELKIALTNTLNLLSESIDLKKVIITEDQIISANSSFAAKGFKYKYYDVYEFQGDDYQAYIANIISEMEQQGLTICQNSKVVGIKKDSRSDGYLVKCLSQHGEKEFAVRKLVIATGALNVQDCLISDFSDTRSSSFEIGVRIEAQSKILANVFTSHGDLKLKHSNGRTYCTTKSGNIITYRSDNYLFTEGCKPIGQPTEFSNFAVLIKQNDYRMLAAFLNNYNIHFNSHPIKQKYSDYLNGCQSGDNLTTTCSLAHIGDINKLFPQKTNEEIKDFLKSIVEDALHLPTECLTIVAPELKLLRCVEISKKFETRHNLFVVGAATGRFRGILQSLCSGIKCGQTLMGE